jgi:predicted nuclease with TOPRIM domain
MIDITKLAEELYEDLKDKYIQLWKERDYLANKVKNQERKIEKLNSDLRAVRYGRKRFNFALKLSKKCIEDYARANKWDLEEVCELLHDIELMKQPPVLDNREEIKENEHEESHTN